MVSGKKEFVCVFDSVLVDEIRNHWLLIDPYFCPGWYEASRWNCFYYTDHHNHSVRKSSLLYIRSASAAVVAIS